MSEDDFVHVALPIRTHEQHCMSIVENPSRKNGVRVQLHPLPDQKSMLVSISPPQEPEQYNSQEPEQDSSHESVDIVVVWDASSSMEERAPLHTAEPGEQVETELTAFDLSKHGTRTMISTLNEKDRLGIVIFAKYAEVVYELSYMNEKNKKEALEVVERLQTRRLTNLWDGLKLGFDMLGKAEPIPQNAQALYVLTDGAPSYGCPEERYVENLRPILQKMKAPQPLIHTFGLGRYVNSGLLQSIAEVGAGRYAFIPDSGMIGTVFNHAVANHFTTFATHAKVTLHCSDSVELTQDEGNKTGIELVEVENKGKDLTMTIGTLQYGQSRDIIVRVKGAIGPNTTIQPSLTYYSWGTSTSIISDETLLSQAQTLPAHVCSFHEFRALICKFLRRLYTKESDFGCTRLERHYNRRAEFDNIIKEMEEAGYTDEANARLLRDLAGPKPGGHVALALSKENFYRWGRHYLLSYLNGHTHQVCNSFEDPGPPGHGKKESYFNRCRSELHECFDTLPTHKPVRIKKRAHDGSITISETHSMASCNARSTTIWNSTLINQTPPAKRQRVQWELTSGDKTADPGRELDAPGRS
ncbi:hypothetical protein FQN55_005909 [Onygenales sp. PD_40]|nr:hypothetical protein FQN55_005909 [Onygenales sp. PD_40]KAK2801020.1 hypothetical protein FQN51_005584 [Onygenales sp. PD_10]